MLVELVVENYAVVERVRVRFHAGFNLLTGETGSGKSIVVDALGLVFGERASADAIRSGADCARVSAIFEGADGEELIVEREILANGKSRAYLNGRPVTVTQLRELAPSLGDIHGQHDQQGLFSADRQRELLDGFGQLDTALVAKLYAEWRAVAAELERLETQEQERLRQADLWAFQKREIQAADLKPGEEEELAQERRRLSNVGKLQTAAAEAYGALDDGAESVAAHLRLALKRLEELTRVDDSLAATVEELRTAEATVQEASRTLAAYLDGLEADPQRLDDVETRLAALDKLKRKYGSTIPEILAYLEQVEQSLEQAESAEDRAKQLRERREVLAASYRTAATKLTSARQTAAKKLEKRVEQELKSLAMERTRLQVSFEAADWSSHGADQVTFLVSPNLGEEPRPMEKVLSGGELSRLALALKCITGTGPAGRTLVFDEVDAGIGGAVAEAVGRRLKDVAADNQVLCVTHLAQVAAYGEHHYVVEKHEVKGRTVASVTELTREQRIQELGRMLAGERVTADVLKHAAQMIA